MPLVKESRRQALWVVGIIAGALLLLSAARFSGILSHRPRPSENLQHFAGAIDHRRQTYDHIKSELYVRASSALKSGDARGAEALYREVVAKYPGDPDGYEALGACLFFQDKSDEARTNYVRALDLNPRSVDALYGLGCVAYKLHRGAEAKDYLEKALLLDQQNGLCHRVLGSVYEELGDARSAILHYERAIELDPSVAGDAVIRKRVQELKR